MTPREEVLSKTGEENFVANDDGIWCPICGNMIMNKHQMGDEDLALPEDCNECGFPDIDEITKYFEGIPLEDE
ncbi:MAG: hypothetical protein ACR2QF_00915 [Geminicoccaceae bacterium]